MCKGLEDTPGPAECIDRLWRERWRITSPSATYLRYNSFAYEQLRYAMIITSLPYMLVCGASLGSAASQNKMSTSARASRECRGTLRLLRRDACFGGAEADGGGSFSAAGLPLHLVLLLAVAAELVHPRSAHALFRKKKKKQADFSIDEYSDRLVTLFWPIAQNLGFSGAIGFGTALALKVCCAVSPAAGCLLFSACSHASV